MCGGKQGHSPTPNKSLSGRQSRRRGVKSALLSQISIHCYAEFVKATLLPKLEQIAKAARRHAASDAVLLSQMRMAVSAQFREINEIEKGIGNCARPAQSMV